MVTMKSTMSADDAKGHFDEVLRRVENNEAVTIERDGEPKAVILSVENYRRLADAPGSRETELEVPEWQRKLDRASEMLSNDLAGKKIDWNEIIYEMREDRSRQLLEYMGIYEPDDE